MPEGLHDNTMLPAGPRHIVLKWKSQSLKMSLTLCTIFHIDSARNTPLLLFLYLWTYETFLVPIKLNRPNYGYSCIAVKMTLEIMNGTNRVKCTVAAEMKSSVSKNLHCEGFFYNY